MTTPTFQEQMHFMSCQAEMLNEEGNDVSAGVMRDASKVLVVEHKRALALEAEVSRLNESLSKATDTQCDQILKMNDKQIEALCRLEGHDPKDEALIAKQVCEIALLKYELSKLTKPPTEELSSPAGHVPSTAEMALDMDIDAIKDAIGKAYPSIDDMTREMLCEKVDRLHTAAFNALPVLPEGWALVPTVPTEDMLIAADEAHGGGSDYQGIYIRMLDEAPAPPACDPSSMFSPRAT